MTIYYDLDGVIRDLHRAVMGFSAEHQDTWNCYRNGIDYCSIVDADLKLLYTAPATKYYPMIKELPFVHIITCQPDHWRPYTMCWIQKRFEAGRFDVDFVYTAAEKLSMLKEGDLIVEDYPLFEDYSKVILIDYPYNRNVTVTVSRVKSPDELRVAIG